MDTQSLWNSGKRYIPPKSFLCGPHFFRQRKVLHWSRAVYAFFFPVASNRTKMTIHLGKTAKSTGRPFPRGHPDPRPSLKKNLQAKNMWPGGGGGGYTHEMGTICPFGVFFFPCFTVYFSSKSAIFPLKRSVLGAWKRIFGPEKDKWWIWGSKTQKPPEMPIKLGKASQHHNWPRYMDWPQIGPKIAIKQGKTPKGEMVPISRAHGGGGLTLFTGVGIPEAGKKQHENCHCHTHFVCPTCKWKQGLESNVPIS